MFSLGFASIPSPPRFQIGSILVLHRWMACDHPSPVLPCVQSQGQMIGEVLKQLDEDRFIVKSSHGPRFVVGVRKKVRMGIMPSFPCPNTLTCAWFMQLDKSKLISGTRVTLDIMTYTIMRALPREVDPTVYSMLSEDPGDVPFTSVGGLSDQIRELREVIELPLTNPELFRRVGIKPPKVGRPLLPPPVPLTCASSLLVLVCRVCCYMVLLEQERHCSLAHWPAT
jgi:hypothetical protein